MASSAPKKVRDGLWEMPQPLGLYAGDLFDRGKGYLSAFSALAERDRGDERHAANFLLVHAIELFLKAFMAMNGVSKSVLRTPSLRHDIAKLLTECERRGLPTVPDLAAYVRHLGHMNSTHDFRYPTGSRLQVPRPRHCLPVIEGLRDAIGPKVAAARLAANVEWAAQIQHLRDEKVRWSD